MTGRLGYEGRPERQNEYFIPGDGISREVIQADICRYLGNDALEMIADLKADSARWEADVLRRADQGYPRGSYIQDYTPLAMATKMGETTQGTLGLVMKQNRTIPL
ncbi:hypothetical protein APSETT444_005043 [Aspergillus pseudonomiae]